MHIYVLKQEYDKSKDPEMVYLVEWIGRVKGGKVEIKRTFWGAKMKQLVHNDH